MNRFCNENCNSCPIVGHKNSRQLTYVLNRLFEKFGDEVYRIAEEVCPNFTVCYDCRIDDFCHIDNCEIAKEVVLDNYNERD